jgi:predicted nucleotidyltransferase
LYGSYAVGQAHPFSDLDIGIYEYLGILDKIAEVSENVFLKDKIQKPARAFVCRDR